MIERMGQCPAGETRRKGQVLHVYSISTDVDVVPWRRICIENGLLDFKSTFSCVDLFDSRTPLLLSSFRHNTNHSSSPFF